MLNFDPLQDDSSGVFWILSLYGCSHKAIEVTYYMFIEQGLFLLPNSLYIYAFISLCLYISNNTVLVGIC